MCQITYPIDNDKYIPKKYKKAGLVTFFSFRLNGLLAKNYPQYISVLIYTETSAIPKRQLSRKL